MADATDQNNATQTGELFISRAGADKANVVQSGHRRLGQGASGAQDRRAGRLMGDLRRLHWEIVSRAGSSFTWNVPALGYSLNADNRGGKRDSK